MDKVDLIKIVIFLVCFGSAGIFLYKVSNKKEIVKPVIDQVKKNSPENNR